MRATIVALGLAAGLLGTAGEAAAQFYYPPVYSAYVPSVYGVGRGPFVGGRYLAAPVYGGFGYPGYGYNYGGFNYGYRSGFGVPGYGYGYPGFGGYGSGFRFGFSYGGFRY